MINPQKPVINLINICNRFTALETTRKENLFRAFARSADLLQTEMIYFQSCRSTFKGKDIFPFCLLFDTIWERMCDRICPDLLKTGDQSDKCSAGVDSFLDDRP